MSQQTHITRNNIKFILQNPITLGLVPEFLGQCCITSADEVFYAKGMTSHDWIQSNNNPTTMVVLDCDLPYTGSGQKIDDDKATKQCISLVGSSANGVVANFNISGLRFGHYTCVARVRSTVNTAAKEVCQVDIKRESTSLATKKFVGSNFSSVSEYDYLYFNFIYQGTKGNLDISLTNLANSGAEIKLDYIYLQPAFAAVFL